MSEHVHGSTTTALAGVEVKLFADTRITATGRRCSLRTRLALLLFTTLVACGESPEPQMLSVSLPDLADPTSRIHTSALPEPALLNLWASWCLPCRLELPQLETLARAGVPVYGLSYRDPPADAQRWLDFFGNPYVRIGIDTTGELLASVARAGVPQSLLVDRNGTIHFHHVGPLNDAIVADRLLPAYRRLADEEIP